MIGGISNLSAYYNPYQGVCAAARQPQQAQNVQPGSAQWGVRKAAQPEAPVQPVTPARPVSGEEGDPAAMAMLRYGSDPTAMAVRMRIQYPGAEQAQAAPAMAGQAAEKAVPGLSREAGGETVPGQVQEGEEVQSAQEVMEEGECQTCKERKYQDGSDDPGVSFKTPTNVAPEQAASAVRGHENEHVVREQAKAQREGRRVVSQSVTYHTAICPECGKVYVSGGTTRTATKADTQQEQPQQDARQDSRAPFSAVA